MTMPNPRFATYRLDDRYTQPRGRVFMTGTQALVRIMLDQARRDRAAGHDTAGFVSGYRGSPLGWARSRRIWTRSARSRACSPCGTARGLGWIVPAMR